MKSAVIKSGGKQYMVQVGSEIVVDSLKADKGAKIDFETLAVFDDDGTSLELGAPYLEKKVQGEIADNVKGEKVRVARFKAKSRYRKVKGFRALLSKVKILAI